MFNNELWQKPAGGGGSDFYDYQIANSVFLNGTSQSLRKTWGSAASDDNKKALSFWIKRTGSTGTRSEIGSVLNTKLVSTNNFDLLELNTNGPSGYSDQFGYTFRAGSNTNWLYQKWRDPSAWMHIIWIWNSDESTTTDRIKFYLNGVNLPIADSTYWNNNNGNPYPNSGEDTNFGKNGNTMHIADYQYNNAEWFGGQMAEFIMIDGAASYTDFGEFKNGVWIPKDPSGLTFGNNGFHLNFASSGDLGNDVSGNNNDFSVIGSIPASAQLLDSPTFNSDSNGGNFNTLNPVDLKSSDAGLANGGLTLTTTAGQRSAFGTMGVSTGKWYFESRQINDTSSNGYPLGIQRISEGLQWKNWTHYIGSAVATYDYSYAMYNKGAGDTSEKVYNDVWTTLTTSSAGVAGTIFQMAFDLDAGKIWFGINNTWTNSGNPSTAANPVFTSLAAGTYATALSITSTSHDYFTHNYGQDGTFAGTLTGSAIGTATDATGYGAFKYAPPTNFLALCAGNLPVADAIDPAQTDDNYPQKLFSPIIYTGNGGTLGVTGLGFKPDFVSIRRRNAGNTPPLYDSTRGNTKLLTTTDAAAEYDQSATPGLSAFGTDGFTVEQPNTGDYGTNRSTALMVAWCQRANGGTTAANSVGGTSSVTQVDPSSGFSIVTYTGFSGSSGSSTVGHGMGVVPQLIIHKARSASGGWWTQNASTTNANYFLEFNDTRAQTELAAGTYGAMSRPTTAVFSINGVDGVGGESRTYIAYCFASIEGYCKVGSYEGNGNADGTFVYTGFRPAFIMTKSIDSTSNWQIFDNKRIGYNVDNNELYANISDAEATTDMIDILSNGFKMRIATDPNVAETYMYLAIAENPFKYATAR